MEEKKQWLPSLLFVLAVFLRLVYLFLIPLGQAPDEIFHFERIYYEKLTLDSKDIINSPILGPNTELVHPPLYYWVYKIFLVLLIQLIRLPSENLISAFMHYGFFLRLINLTFSVITLYLWKVFLDKLKLSKYLYLLSLIILFFIPTLVGSSFSINIDSLYLFLTSCVIVYLPNLINKEDFNKILIVGIFTGLALLTKLYSIGIIFSVIYLLLWKYRYKSHQLLKSLVLYLLPVFLLTGWWFINNIINYNDPFATDILRISTITNIKPFAFKGYILMFLYWSYQTFLVSFGSTNNIRLANFLYSILALLIIFSLIGIFKKKSKVIQSQVLNSLALFSCLNFLQMVYLNFRISFQPQGRYLFATLPFYSVLLSLGITNISSKKSKWKSIVFVAFLFIVLHILSLNCLLWYYLNIVIIPPSLVCKLY